MSTAEANRRAGAEPPRGRVLMVLESVFPHPRGGGAEGQVRTLAAHLVQRGLAVDVVAPMVRDGPQKARDELDGLGVVRIGYPKIPKLGGVFMLLGLALFLARHGRRYHVFHAHIAHNMAGVSCLLGRVLGRKVIVKLTGGFEMDQGILSPARTDLRARLLRWSLRHASHYHVISSRLADLLPAFGFDRRKIRSIPNSVDTARFRPREAALARRALGLNAELVGVFVGRLVREKALDSFMEGWAGAFRESDEVALLIVGSGELEASLKQQAARLSRTHQIRFLGPRSDVEHLLAAADFGILPSSCEGLSNALLEYMAAGLPVLGSRVSGTEDLITHGREGWLFESGKRAELETRLAEIAATPTETRARMGRLAREKAVRVAEITSVAERVADLYGLPLAPAS